jgi:hypothetical protein
VERSGVEHQHEAGADVSRPKVRHVAVDQPRVDAGLSDSVAPATQCLFDDVDAGHPPAPLGELDSPDRAAGADVESRAVGPSLLTLEQGADPLNEARLLLGFLPRMKADPVCELVVQDRLPGDFVVDRRTIAIAAPFVGCLTRSTIGAGQSARIGEITQLGERRHG